MKLVNASVLIAAAATALSNAHGPTSSIFAAAAATTQQCPEGAKPDSNGACLSPDTDKVIWDAMMSQWHLPSVTVALELKLFDLIEQSPDQGLNVSQIAKEFSLPTDRALKALLQALVALRYLEKVEKGASSEAVYRCTPSSRSFLANTNPDFFWGNMLAVMKVEESHSRLMDAVKEDDIYGAPMTEGWESGELTEEQARELTSAFHSHSLYTASSAAKNYPLTGINHLLDIGGGSGCFSAAFVEANEELSATIMDLPQVCNVAKEINFDKKPAGIKDRLHTHSVDFFREAWPTPMDGYDAILFSNILHDWSFETCRELIKKSFATLPSGGKIMLHEMLLDSDNATAAFFSIHMAVYTRGQQFFFAELKDMLEEAGFANVASSKTHEYYSIVSALKP